MISLFMRCICMRRIVGIAPQRDQVRGQMNHEHSLQHDDLRRLIRMVQLSRQRAALLQETQEIESELARLRRECDPQLRRSIDELTLIEIAPNRQDQAAGLITSARN